MSTKLKKAIKEIEKTEKIIKENQDKLKVLNKERTDLENLAMVDILRKNKIQPGELKSIVDILHEERGNTIPLKTELECEKDEK